MELPKSCPNVQQFTHKNCDVSFKGRKNLRQDTDNCVYCVSCGQVIGIFPGGTVPFVERDDNAWP